MGKTSKRRTYSKRGEKLYHDNKFWDKKTDEKRDSKS